MLHVLHVLHETHGGNALCQAHGPGANGLTAKAGGGRLSGGISLRPGGGLRHWEGVGRCRKVSEGAAGLENKKNPLVSHGFPHSDDQFCMDPPQEPP